MPYPTAVLKDGTDKRGVNPQLVRGKYSTTFKDAKDIRLFDALPTISLTCRSHFRLL